MKNIILIGLFSVFFFNTVLAQKCKPFLKETDDFTEITTKYYGNLMGSKVIANPSSSLFVLIGVSEKNQQVRAKFRVYLKENEYKLAQDNWISKLDASENKLLIKTESEALTFTSVKHSFNAKEKLNDYTVDVDLYFEISDTNLQKLSTGLVQKVRLIIGNQEHDYKVKKKAASKFSKNASCALQEKAD